jgi:hypothetical protein
LRRRWRKSLTIDGLEARARAGDNDRSVTGHLDTIEANRAWALATVGRLIITVWRIDVTLARVNLVDTAIRGLVPRCGKAGYSSITVLEPGVSMRLPDDARDASTQLQRRWDDHMRCSGYLVEGSGFLPAAVRTMTSGLALFTRSKAKIRVFSEAGVLADWISPSIGTAPRDVVRALFDIRGAGIDRTPVARSM